MPDRPPSPDTLNHIARIRRRIEGFTSSPEASNASSPGFPQIREAERLLHINNSTISDSENDEVIDEIKDNLFAVEPANYERGKRLDQALCLVEQLRRRLITCPICYNLTTDAQKTPCQHVFCRFCIQRWLKDPRHCPNCRGRLTLRELRPANVEDQDYSAEEDGRVGISSVTNIQPTESVTPPLLGLAEFSFLNEQNEDAAIVRHRSSIISSRGEHPLASSDDDVLRSSGQVAIASRPLTPMHLPMPLSAGSEDLSGIIQQALADRISIGCGSYDPSVKREAVDVWYDISYTESLTSSGAFMNEFRNTRIRRLAARLALLTISQRHEGGNAE